MDDSWNRRTMPDAAVPEKRLLPPGPLKVVRDRFGRLWICSANVDEGTDLAGQNCWRCGDLTFTSRS